MDEGEPDHQACRLALASLTGPMITTWPVFTESMYLLGEAGGWRAQHGLWQMVRRDDLIVVDLGQSQLERTQTLMEKYKDIPMSLADATLVALAEARRLYRIFTLDADFSVYRIRGREVFQIVP